MNFSYLAIGARLQLGFASILAIVVLVAAIGIYELDRANDATKKIVEVNIEKMDHLEEMSNSVHIVARVVRTLAILRVSDQAVQERQKIAIARDKYDDAFDALRKMPLDSEGREFVRSITEIQNATRLLNNKFVEMSSAADPGAASYLLTVAGPATNEWQNRIRNFISLQKKKSLDDAAVAEKAFREALLAMCIVTLLALLVGIILAIKISRSIIGPINTAVNLARKVAAGDLTSHVEVDPNNRSESGVLISVLAEMNSSLNGIVREVREGAVASSDNAKEIADGNLDLSNRTEQQASALEESASSLEEITAAVRQNAENASQASLLASDTVSIAERGGEAVNEVVERMASIEESSKRIVAIISVIDSIAFQTNILALNAAVEAARAGEQGRGFAVVASEVRTLAQRSATAAQEIKQLITTSVSEIASGGDLARDAGITMTKIVAAIGKVSQFVADISHANREQSTGIEQTFAAVSEIDRLTQSNAALVEQLAATAENLNERANGLSVLVRHFIVNENIPSLERSTGRSLVLHASLVKS